MKRNYQKQIIKKKKKKEKEDSINSNNIFDAGKRKEGKKRTSTIKAKGLINQLKKIRGDEERKRS